ncbi:hypothetical protein PHMEG_00037068 [Phytophthora megakarya]|uniref:Chromo domain-containing protein n=1 Tax=Phytophthora megakarya TaxID=4795 RepID=A0A225UKF5_9STRA|nr:hypothetical protein PHMEG_00037068 [Phytophthora megakarya]
MDGTRGRHLKQLFRWDRHVAVTAMHGDGGITYRDNTAEPGKQSTRVYVMRSSPGPNSTMKTIEEGTQVWLYLDRVKEGYARKLAHMWHGPFRVTELIGNHAARLETAGSGYRIFPIVHLSKLKPVVLKAEDDDRVDFHEELLPDDSWDTPLDEDEFEVERIADLRSGRRTRYGRVHREFQVYWKGYDQPTWVDEADLNCAALLYEYERGRPSRNRFNVMQSHEEGVNVE